MGNFYSDLELGQLFEDEVIDYFGRDIVTSTQENGLFSKYDFKVQVGDMVSYFEVKFDRQAAITKNIAIEIKSKNREGREWNSGLSATEAEFYVFGFDVKREVYYISVDKLKSMIEEKKYTAITDFEGDGYASLALFRLDEFLKECHVLFLRDIKKFNEELQRRKQTIERIRKAYL